MRFGVEFKCEPGLVRASILRIWDTRSKGLNPSVSLCLTGSALPGDRCGSVFDRATLHELLMVHVGRVRVSGRAPIKAGSHLGHDHGLVFAASGVKHKPP